MISLAKSRACVKLKPNAAIQNAVHGSIDFMRFILFRENPAGSLNIGKAKDNEREKPSKKATEGSCFSQESLSQFLLTSAVPSLPLSAGPPLLSSCRLIYASLYVSISIYMYAWVYLCVPFLFIIN